MNAPAGNGGSAGVAQANAPKLKSGTSGASFSVGSASIGHTSPSHVSNGGSGGSVVAGSVTGRKRKAASHKAPSDPDSSSQTTSTPPAPIKTPAPTSTPAPTKTPAATEPPAATKPPAPTKTTSKPATAPAQHTTSKTVVRTVVKTKVRTIVKVRTVTKTLRPDVPSTAFVPSRHQALALTSFTVSGSNVGCAIGGNGVRCSIQRRVWAAPAQPLACRKTWGDTIAMANAGPAKFVCGGSSGFVTDANVIPDGWDDTVGKFTCQVRAVGVDCFSKTHHGFIISRTGYAAF